MSQEHLYCAQLITMHDTNIFIVLYSAVVCYI